MPHRRTSPSLRRPPATLVALVLVLLASACEPPLLPLGDPTGTPSAGSALIGCEQAGQLITIAADSHLDPGCTYTGGFEIVGSDVVFDCRGARIEDVAGTRSRGIHVHAPTDVALERVTVRNCIIVGFLNNVRVSRDGFKDLVQGEEYGAPFADIVIENSRLLDSRGSGLFVNGYVTGVTIQDLEIARSGNVGVYLEAGSKGSVVRRNHIHHNGFGDVDPVNGVPQIVNGLELRVEMTGREGIAVDGSRDNRIADNSIHSNAAGGIFLYKNCGEFATQQPGAWWERWYGADGNVIERNAIVLEDNGIWVGSRMAENQLFMDCSDPTYVDGPGTRIHLDHAEGNTLRDNLLVAVGNAVRVEDDGTVVEGNRIFHADPTARGILLGTKHRTATLDQPVQGTVIRGNEVSNAGASEAYAWIHGHEGTVFDGNVLNGSAATLTPGTQPPINPFLMVVRIWLP